MKKTQEQVRKEVAKHVGLKLSDDNQLAIKHYICDGLAVCDKRAKLDKYYNLMTCTSDRCMTTAENLAMCEARVRWLVKELMKQSERVCAK
jgi:hypothetical protein